MSEWLDNQKQSSWNFSKLLQERTERANPRRKLTAEETKRLAKFKASSFDSNILEIELKPFLLI